MPKVFYRFVIVFAIILFGLAVSLLGQERKRPKIYISVDMEEIGVIVGSAWSRSL